jgi:hypothetical protein
MSSKSTKISRQVEHKAWEQKAKKIFFSFFAALGFKLRAYTLSHSTSLSPYPFKKMLIQIYSLYGRIQSNNSD